MRRWKNLPNREVNRVTKHPVVEIDEGVEGSGGGYTLFMPQCTHPLTKYLHDLFIERSQESEISPPSARKGLQDAENGECSFDSGSGVEGR